MKILKKILLIAGIILLLLFFKGSIYRACIKYKPVKKRTGYTVHSSALIKYIDNSDLDSGGTGINNVIALAGKLTNEKLTFTTSHCPTDPNIVVNSLQTHCVGYAQFYAATCNFLCKKNRLSGRWHANAYAAKLYLFGNNVHLYFNSPFFKDHDFVIVENSETGDKIYVDPTISDYLGIDRVAVKTN